MSWRTITITEVRLTPQEKAAMQAIQDSTSVGAEILVNVVGEFRDAIASSGGELDTAGKIPDLVRLHVINRTRWLWLCEFPQLKSLQTEVRQQLNDSAEKMLADINAREVAAPPVSDSAFAAGSWNSENKVVPRAHPVPRPGTQFQGDAGRYANPDGPEDETE